MILLKMSALILTGIFLSYESFAAEAYIPSNLDKVKEVFIVHNASTKHLVNSYIQVLDRQNSKLSKAEKIRLTIFVGDSMLDEVYRSLSKSAKDYVSISPHPMAEDDAGGVVDWLQDTGEFFYKADGKTSFLYHESSPHFPLWDELQKKRNVEVLKVSGEYGAEETIEGGNIETTPKGSVYVGDDMAQSIVDKLGQIVGANKVFRVPTTFGSVSHVDETYQFVPDKSGGCGYALTYKDLLDGLRIALEFGLYNGIQKGHDGGPDRAVTAKDYFESIAYFTGLNLQGIPLKTEDLHELIAQFDFSRHPRPFKSTLSYRMEDVYIYKAFHAQRQILEGLATLKKAVATEGCRNLKTVSMPGLWTYGFNDQAPHLPESIDEVLNLRIGNLTAFSNFVVLNDTLILADTKAPAQILYFLTAEEFARIGAKLKEAVGSRLGALGIRDLVYVDMTYGLLGDGSPHCKTAVRRGR